MARAVGLDVGEFEVKLVELDGSYRRPRLASIVVEPVVDAGGDEQARPQRAAEAAQSAFEQGGQPRDSFSMSFPCREAVLRHLTVPFVGREQIRKVIKFEAEGSIHSHNVDDMVVDFYPLGERDGETRVIVAAVPKPALRASLTALQRVGLEPEVVDLDTLALFRAAQWCDAFNGVKDAADAGDAASAGDGNQAGLVPAAEAAAPTRLVLDLGARSTRVLVVVGGKLVDMRTLRTGADAMAQEIGAVMGVGLAQAREAVEESLRTDEDFVVVGPEDPTEPAEPEAGGDSGGALPAVVEEGEAQTQLVPHSEVAAARDRYLSRLRRELIRFLTAVPAMTEVEAVWITGGASTTPGVSAVLEEVFGLPPKPLDVLARLNHKLDRDEARVLAPKVAIAVGLALDALAGRQGFNFRQEELAFTKGFDRIKFPLAIASMLALFTVLVFGLKSWRELREMKRLYGSDFSIEDKTVRGKTETVAHFNGYVGCLVNPNGSWFDNDRYFDAKRYKRLVANLIETDTFLRLPIIKQDLRSYYLEQQKKSGYYADLRPGSGLGALVEMADVLKRIEPQLGRYLITQINLRLHYREGSRYLDFEVALRTDEQSDFRAKWRVLEQAFREQCTRPESSFKELHDRETREKPPPFESPAGNGSHFGVRIVLKPESSYPIFPPQTT